MSDNNGSRFKIYGSYPKKIYLGISAFIVMSSITILALVCYYVINKINIHTDEIVKIQESSNNQAIMMTELQKTINNKSNKVDITEIVKAAQEVLNLDGFQQKAEKNDFVVQNNIKEVQLYEIITILQLAKFQLDFLQNRDQYIDLLYLAKKNIFLTKGVSNQEQIIHSIDQEIQEINNYNLVDLHHVLSLLNDVEQELYSFPKINGHYYVEPDLVNIGTDENVLDSIFSRLKNIVKIQRKKQGKILNNEEMQYIINKTKISIAMRNNFIFRENIMLLSQNIEDLNLQDIDKKDLLNKITTLKNISVSISSTGIDKIISAINQELDNQSN